MFWKKQTSSLILFDVILHCKYEPTMKLSRKSRAMLLAAVFSTSCLGMSAANYSNPIIDADYSDPDAIRVGNDYYLTASSFANTPGLPILHSTDLVNWEIINHAITKVPPYDFYSAAPQHGKGVWAPSIRHHNGLFYIYWGDPDFGIFLTTAEDPAGKWSEPVLVKAGKGMIDPVPLWDEDGKVYMVHGWAGSRIGFNSVISVFELSEDGTKAISDPVMVFDGNDGVNHTIEGPKLYKRDGYYWIFSPAGGVVDGWQLAMRSKNIYGPYEPRIVMEQGKSVINGPHQGALIDTPDGKEWFLHFQDKGLYGRVLHLNPVEWKDGWPVIGKNIGKEAGEPCLQHEMPIAGTRQTRRTAIKDSFDSISLAPQWEWAANYADWYGFPTNAGFYRVNSAILGNEEANLWTVPSLLVQKYPGESFTATTKIEVNSKENSEGFLGGLVLFGYDYGFIAIQNQDGKYRLVQGECIDSDKGEKQTLSVIADNIPLNRYAAGLFPNLNTTIWLRATVAKGGKATFEYSLDGKKYQKSKNSFQSRQGKWVGAKVGIFSTVPPATERGWINIDDFNIENIK